MSAITKTLIAVSLFSIAMAALESAVVVYLRALYYPEGFTVAFNLINQEILLVELFRELSTLIMLGCVGYLAGNNFKERLAWFLVSFGVWDIFYYGWLKVFIDWPSSVLDWDILFLIPFTWLAPVLAPLICSLSMIVLAVVLLRTRHPITGVIWSFLIMGCILILFTFMEHYGWIIISNGFLSEYPSILQNQDFLKIASGFIPTSFRWSIFLIGQLFILGGIYGLHRGLKDVRAAQPRAWHTDQ